MTRIVVAGEAEHRQAPERGTLRVQLEFTGDVESRAMRQAADCHGQIVSAVKALVEAGHVTWWSADNIVAGPFYDYQAKLRRTRFRAEAGLRVRFCDFTQLAKFSAQLAGTDGVTVGRVTWSLAEATRNELMTSVRLAAAHDATRRATEYAQGLGLGPVRPVALYEQGLREKSITAPNLEAPQTLLRGLSAAQAEPAEVTVRPEEIVLTVTITADFDADPA